MIRSKTGLLLLCVAFSMPTRAATSDEDTLTALRAELTELKAAQDRIAAQQQEVDRAMHRVETELARLQLAVPVASQPPVAHSPGPAFTLNGDFRLRGQGDYSDGAAPVHNSMQVRARLGATYAVNEHFTLGARLGTG